MKSKIVYTLISALLVLAGCGFDNYEEPKSTLSGRVVYNGQNVNVMGTGNLDNSVRLELWQKGYDLYTAIPVMITQDGTFQAKLFDGNYKLVSRSGSGPWVSNQDTVNIVVKGNTVVDYPVTPYYTISSENISISGNTVTATFNINAVAGELPVERAFLVVSKTSFTDENNHLAIVNMNSPSIGQQTITMTLTDTQLNSVVLNARVGVKVSGRTGIYTPVKKLK
jgi:hypothetical protein